jgi:hypothetical protein
MTKLVCWLAAAAAAAALITTAAGAHSWYPHECCHDNDCRPAPCEEMKDTRYDLTWRGVVVFPEPMVRASPDGLCQVCVKEYPDFVPYVPLCVFVPQGVS